MSKATITFGPPPATIHLGHSQAGDIVEMHGDLYIVTGSYGCNFEGWSKTNEHFRALVNLKTGFIGLFSNEAKVTPVVAHITAKREVV